VKAELLLPNHMDHLLLHQNLAHAKPMKFPVFSLVIREFGRREWFAWLNRGVWPTLTLCKSH
jgi:hypothetical protein